MYQNKQQFCFHLRASCLKTGRAKYPKLIPLFCAKVLYVQNSEGSVN